MTNPVTQPDPPIYLDDLSLDDLQNLSEALARLVEAGLASLDRDPRFTVAPGRALAMRLNYQMPMAKPVGPFGIFASPYPRAPTFDEVCAAAAIPGAPTPNDVGPDDVAPAPPADGGEMEGMLNEVFQAVGLGKGRDRDPFDTRCESEPAGPAVAVVVLARDAAPNVDPAPAADISVETPKGLPGQPWLDEEDARLVRLCAEAKYHGTPQAAAIRQAATEFSRSAKSCEVRAYRGLATRIIDALEDLRQAGQPQPAPSDPEPSDPQPFDPASAALGPEAAAAPDAAPTPAANAAWHPDHAPKVNPDLSPIDSHILALPTKGGWGIERDRELMDLVCDGWGTPEIAMEMGLSGREVTDRFNLLTGLNGETKTRAFTRAFTRDDLLAALTAWSARSAAAAE